VRIEKQRGRIEARTHWRVAAGARGDYLAQEDGWPGIAQVGWLQRRRQQVATEPAPAVEQVSWISSLPRERVSAERIAQVLRGHWVIEQGVHRVRDVRYNEDRLHGRKRGVLLAAIRNAASAILRQQGYPDIPDGWRHLSAQLDRGIKFLLEPL
jgi:hypothetical protein